MQKKKNLKHKMYYYGKSKSASYIFVQYQFQVWLFQTSWRPMERCETSEISNGKDHLPDMQLHVK